MPYEPELNPDARNVLDQLPIDVQERVWDFLEQLVNEADALPNRPLSFSVIESDDWLEAGEHHYLFIAVEYDPPSRRLLAQRIMYFSVAA